MNKTDVSISMQLLLFKEKGIQNGTLIKNNIFKEQTLELIILQGREKIS
jgi:hypothetical protein